MGHARVEARRDHSPERRQGDDTGTCIEDSNRRSVSRFFAFSGRQRRRSRSSCTHRKTAVRGQMADADGRCLHSSGTFFLNKLPLISNELYLLCFELGYAASEVTRQRTRTKPLFSRPYARQVPQQISSCSR